MVEVLALSGRTTHAHREGLTPDIISMERDLSHVPMLRDIPESALKAIGPLCTLRHFKKGETVFEEGQPAEWVWIVRRGWVYLVKRTPRGGVATIFAMTPDEALCGVSAFDHGVYSAGAVAATESELIRIPAEAFAGLLENYSEFAKQVLLTCCTRMRHMAEAISLSQAPVEQRLAYTLLRLQSSFGSTIPITHRELARMMGTRLETSIRAVSIFKRRGWLSTMRGKMTILCPEEMKASLTASGWSTDFPQTGV